MPKGPQGQKRPADVIGNAVHVMRVARERIASAVTLESSGFINKRNDPETRKSARHDLALVGIVHLVGGKNAEVSGREDCVTDIREDRSLITIDDCATSLPALYTVWYNFARIHSTVRMAPAMACGLSNRLWEMDDDMVRLVEA